jgi:transcriptional regulator with XRE-family HTH domain
MSGMETDPSWETIPRWTRGDRLRKARLVAGVSPEEMADLLEVTDRTIRNYEQDRTPIKRPAVAAWALRTGIDREWLWNGIEPDDDGSDAVTMRDRQLPFRLRLASLGEAA